MPVRAFTLYLLLVGSAPATAQVCDSAAKADPPEAEQSFAGRWTGRAGLPSLRSAAVAPDDIELRLWHGNGPVVPAGLVMRRTAGTWSAETYRQHWPDRCFQRASVFARADWAAVWQAVEQDGLLRLPASPKHTGSLVVLDGTFYLMEVRLGSAYRHWEYFNPDAYRTAADQGMLKVLKALLHPLGVRYPGI